MIYFSPLNLAVLLTQDPLGHQRYVDLLTVRYRLEVGVGTAGGDELGRPLVDRLGAPGDGPLTNIVLLHVAVIVIPT